MADKPEKRPQDEPEKDDKSAARKKAIRSPEAWREARALMWSHRRYLGIGFVLMVVSRLAGLVPAASSKYLIDEIVAKHRADLLWPLAGIVATAMLVQAVTSFSLSQVISVTAQRAITNMRRRVQRHVTRMPIRYFDSTQVGVLVSRVMNDAEGIRNLVGTGVVQLVGGVFTALVALGVLFYLNWQLTIAILVVFVAFGVAMSLTFNRLRPIFRERGKINAEVTGRLTETLGGIRVVKAYGTEKREERVFAGGAHRLFRNIARSITGVSLIGSVGTLVVGTVGVIMIIV
ncbi:MAG TPA: ABC transporter ATP-binding protein, partial [Longimicrobium sp.]|nr:ABC transporter ATP-binding protein [Longimicrobium sp.]